MLLWWVISFVIGGKVGVILFCIVDDEVGIVVVEGKGVVYVGFVLCMVKYYVGGYCL